MGLVRPQLLSSHPLIILILNHLAVDPLQCITGVNERILRVRSNDSHWYADLEGVDVDDATHLLN